MEEEKRDVNEHEQRRMNDKSDQYFALKKQESRETGIKTAKQN